MSTKYQNKYCRSVKDQLGVGSPEGLYPAFFLVVFCLSRTAVPSSGNQCGSVAELVTMNRHQKENIAWLFNVYEKADMRHHTPIISITNTSRRRTNSSPRRTTIFGHNTIHHSYHTWLARLSNAWNDQSINRDLPTTIHHCLTPWITHSSHLAGEQATAHEMVSLIPPV